MLRLGGSVKSQTTSAAIDNVSKKSPTSLFYLPSQAKNPAESFSRIATTTNANPGPNTWISNSVVPFPRADDDRFNAQHMPPKQVDQAAVERATRMWRESPKYPGEGNARFFQYALALRSAGISLNDIEQKLRDEAGFGRSPGERRAQIPSIMKTLGQSFKKFE
jgi:hypothetical protein